MAQAAVDLNARVLMPIHWAKFSLAMHTWKEPVERLTKRAGELGVPLLTPPHRPHRHQCRSRFQREVVEGASLNRSKCKRRHPLGWRLPEVVWISARCSTLLLADGALGVQQDGGVIALGYPADINAVVALQFAT